MLTELALVVPSNGRLDLPREWVGHKVVVKIDKRTRSQRANAYYWSCVIDLTARETGNSADDLHDAACEQFIPNESKQIEFFSKTTGEFLSLTVDHRRSSKLKGQEFFDFVELTRDWIQRFFNVTTPPPDPDYWRKR